MNRTKRLRSHVELIAEVANLTVQLLSVAGMIVGVRRCATTTSGCSSAQ